MKVTSSAPKGPAEPSNAESYRIKDTELEKFITTIPLKVEARIYFLCLSMKF